MSIKTFYLALSQDEVDRKDFSRVNMSGDIFQADVLVQERKLLRQRFGAAKGRLTKLARELLEVQ